MLKEFHPSVAQWFLKTFESPSDIQKMTWPEIKKGKNTLIAAPTGSGKTLAAFFAIIDDLIKEGLHGTLAEKTKVVYVSPLKALSNDIEKNLRFPLKGIEETLKQNELPEVKLKVAVRTGDTPSSERASMIKKPPHILVTTPESLYLLLTSVNGRKLLSDVETVILDEIHALLDNKRGSHLSLSLERLENLVSKKLIRVGLSATQNPIEKVADFMAGNGRDCKVINLGHKRNLDLALEIPRSPMSAVMPNEVWEEIYGQLERLILTHETTLIFVNTRRLAERMAHQLSERLGENVITAHHGSMSKEQRHDAEQRLKSGTLKALIATASLELGIDIGSIDLVCQIGSSKSIATFLQRVGRAGHSLKGTPKGRIFPLTRDELIECTATLDAVRRSELDKIIIPEKPVDVLSQQIIAEVACDEYSENDLFDMVTKAYPYRDLDRKEFDGIITMLSEGFSTRKGRKSAYLHRDIVNEKLKGRKGARLIALVSGGTIPDQFDFDVVLDPGNIFIGTVNEDFAIESLPGDVFQLGNSTWRILKVENSKVRVQDAQGLPPSIPFWLGEAPGRSAELSVAVSRLRQEISDRLGDMSLLKPLSELDEDEERDESWKAEAIHWLTDEVGIQEAAADQIVTYLAAAQLALGAMPTQDTIVTERFFDEAGDMHLVIHSPFGSRMNRAWGLSLRKRFCRKFNFELQAAATEDSIILSLGATHSFQLDEVFKYLNPKTVREVLIQALLDAPMFEVRWRWNASTALAILRRLAGKKVPPPIQRMNAEDLIAQVFPDQLACLENIVGERELPDHPLVNQTIKDCLTEAMDIDTLENFLKEVVDGQKNLIAKDLREASPLAQEILNARPYAFLDPAGLEERRTHAVRNRRWLDPAEAKDLGKLDIRAIESVKAEAWPQVSNADELHDALALNGYITEKEGITGNGLENWEVYLEQLIREKRASVLRTKNITLWIAIERLPQLMVVLPEANFHPKLEIPQKLQEKKWEFQNALVELVRGRLEALGPVTADQLTAELDLAKDKLDQALLVLENEGFVFRGSFTPDLNLQEWCERRLLARIHRYTLQKLRKEIEPVSAADFMKFLFQWQGVAEDSQTEGPNALINVIEQLEGFEAPAAAWEADILPARVKEYDYLWLDVVCLSGKTSWGKFRNTNKTQNGVKNTPIKSSPISLINRSNIDQWISLGEQNNHKDQELSARAQKVFDILNNQGASFFDDIEKKSDMLRSEVEEAISELVSKGMITSDSFTGLRALLLPIKYKTARGRNKKNLLFNMDQSGRWSLINYPDGKKEISAKRKKEINEFIVRILLKRYGVIFRKLIERESFAPPWRDLISILRLMEARGEIRGGRFVQGVWGEQFSLPEALTKLRKIKNEEKSEMLVTISAADPLNLTGVITPGKRISAFWGNRILYKNGVPVAIKEGKEIKYLESPNYLNNNKTTNQWELRDALVQRKISPKLRKYLGKGIF